MSKSQKLSQPNVLLRKWTWLSAAFCLLPVIPGLFLYSSLPAQVAVHFGANGVPDGWMPKAQAVFLMPLVFAGLDGLVLLMTYGLSKKFEYPRKVQVLFLLLVPIIGNLAVISTFLAAIHPGFNIASVILSLVGIVFIALGNYMPKVGQNSLFGIRTKWTYASPEVWRRTNRLGGWLFILLGLLMLMAALIQSEAMLVFNLILVLIVSFYLVWYSRNLYFKLEDPKNKPLQ